MIRVAPSILSADFADLGAEIRAVERAGADWIHVDVMDGHFVPNISMGPLVAAAIRRHIGTVMDVHLMIEPVEPYLAAFARAGADHITFHLEAVADPAAVARQIRALGCLPGLALKPDTPASAAAPVLDEIGLLLPMTVEPGFGGQAFMAAMLPKIAELRAMIGSRAIHLQVDGGITPATAPEAIAAGAEVLVAGSSVFGGNRADWPGRIAALRPPAGPRVSE
jgi:ribulose-phosphate 3-epimerase